VSTLQSGSAVGATVGVKVGLAVGLAVGAGVGAAIGSGSGVGLAAVSGVVGLGSTNVAEAGSEFGSDSDSSNNRFWGVPELEFGSDAEFEDGSDTAWGALVGDGVGHEIYPYPAAHVMHIIVGCGVANVGTVVGFGVGSPDLYVGNAVGMAEGLRVGRAVGAAVGRAVGRAVGGAVVGLAVGHAVVGAGVGRVGCGVGPADGMVG